MIVLVPLGGVTANGRSSPIDAVDDWVLEYSWSVSATGYVQGRVDGKVVKLHRLICGFPQQIVDHINRNPLDNRRANLRLTDSQGNARNKSKRPGMTSQFVGVYRHTQTGRWVATGSLYGRSIYLGRHATEESAAETSREWRIQTFGYDRVPGDATAWIAPSSAASTTSSWAPSSPPSACASGSARSPQPSTSRGSPKA